jgi:tRNA-2-methylthio-N6-dimethylallyladenosine synthase
MSKKLYIKTYGCQMNVYDSIKMGELLKPHGFELSEEALDADMVILNTCHIREKATEKVYSELGKIKRNKERKKAAGSDMVIAVAGCVGQAEGEQIIKRSPFVDIVVGPQSYHNLPTLLEEVKRSKGWVVDLDFPTESKFDSLPDDQSQGVSAFLSIQEGCDKFCHFCCVPYTRGAEYSRPISDIFREANKLVGLGAKEITLLGQNVSAYHGEGPEGQAYTIGRLIKMLAKIDGLERIRYTTSHPRDMTDEELFEVHASEPKLMPYLHLPVQAGADKVLKEMNRKHTRDFYFEIIEKFRKAQPEIAFSSDFIVGYPGETEQDFEDTLDLVRQVKFAQAYSFKYSPRPGTPASALSNQIPEEVKIERLARLQELLMQQQLEFNRSCVGKTLPVLFDKPGRYEGQVMGKSPYMQSVYIQGSTDLIGAIYEVDITNASQNAISGQLSGEQVRNCA